MTTPATLTTRLEHAAPNSARRHGTTPRPGDRRAALVAGWSYALLFLLAIGANLVVLEGLVTDDPTATARAIVDEAALFRAGTVGFVLIALVDVVIAVALHRLLRRTHRVTSAVAALLRVAYSAVLLVAVGSLVAVDGLVAGLDPTAADPATLALDVTRHLERFDTVWQAGLLLFGLHLVLVAALLRRAGEAPWPLRLLLAVAGTSYVLDAVLRLTVPDAGGAVAAVLLGVVATSSMLGEGWFTGWLLARGGRARSTE